MTLLNAAKRLISASADAFASQIEREFRDKLSDILEDDGVEVSEVSGRDERYLVVEPVAEDQVVDAIKALDFKPVGLPKNRAYVLKRLGHNLWLSLHSSRGQLQIHLGFRND